MLNVMTSKEGSEVAEAVDVAVEVSEVEENTVVDVAEIIEVDIKTGVTEAENKGMVVTIAEVVVVVMRMVDTEVEVATVEIVEVEEEMATTVVDIEVVIVEMETEEMVDTEVELQEVITTTGNNNNNSSNDQTFGIYSTWDIILAADSTIPLTC